MKPPLREYRRNVYSQQGEDGVLEELCRRLDLREGAFVEFGAWDGKHLSNTFNLLEHHGWRGVYIEMEPARYAQLIENTRPFGARVVALCARVDVEGPNALDRLLAPTATPRAFEVLSIDIDSFDLQVWQSVRDYTPAIVVIEGNSRILPGIHQVHTPGVAQGSSFTSLVELGREKGYVLVCHTGNLFFVRRELAGRLELDPRDVAEPERLFDHARRRDELTHNVWHRRLGRFAYRLRERLARAKRALLAKR